MSVEKFVGKQNVFYFTRSKLADKFGPSQIPLAIILGWSGSVDNNVKKFTKIYEDFGYHTIRFSPSDYLVLFQTHLHKKLALELLDLVVNKHQLTQNPIIIHTFSNAGLFIYRYLSEFLHENINNEKCQAVKQNFKTLVSDSGPAFPVSIKDLIVNMTELMENRIKYKLMRYTIAIGGSVAWCIKHNIIFNRNNNYFMNFYQAMIKDKFQVPCLLYYSTIDRLNHVSYILEYIKRRRELNPNLILKPVEFTDTEHVMHYLKYPRIYYKNLKDHLISLNLPLHETFDNTNTDAIDNLPLVTSKL